MEAPARNETSAGFRSTYVPEAPRPCDLAAMDGLHVARENPSKPKFKPLTSAKSSSGLPMHGGAPRLALGTLSGNSMQNRGSVRPPNMPFFSADSLLNSSKVPLGPMKAGEEKLTRLIQETSARNAALKEAEMRRTSLTSSVRPKSLVTSDFRLSSAQLGRSDSILGNVPRVKGAIVSKEDQERLRRRRQALEKRQFSASVLSSVSTSTQASVANNELDRSLLRKSVGSEDDALVVHEEGVQEFETTDEKVAEFKSPLSLPDVEQEEREREQRREKQREEEAFRKADELVERADLLKTAGQIAAAIAVMKEALELFPDNAEFKTKVRTLRSLLLESRNQPKESVDSDDPLEALFSAVSSTITVSTDVVASNDTQASESGARPFGADEEVETIETRIDRLVNSHERMAQKVLRPMGNIVEALLNITMFQKQQVISCNQGSKVKFHPMDCAVEPPPAKAPLSDEDFASALFPIDMVLDQIQTVVRFGDEARKGLRGFAQWRQELQPFVHTLLDAQMAPFVECTIRLSMGQPCVCMESNKKSSCTRGAVSPRERMSQLLSSGLRFCLRRLFNDRGMYLDAASSGSYRYAMDDIAAVAHTAMLLYETRQSSVETTVLLGKSNACGDNTQIARVGEFVEAHRFLTTLFPSERHCLDLSDADPACFAKLRKYLSVARDFKCEDELVLHPLANLTDLVKKLKEQATLVSAARSHVEVAFKRMAKEDKCGQCTCDGARRRRAAALGTWIAPALKKGQAVSHARTCAKCSKSLAEKDAQVACECCEMMFHPKCANMPSTGILADFVCSKCVPKFKSHSAAAQERAEEDDD